MPTFVVIFHVAIEKWPNILFHSHYNLNLFFLLLLTKIFIFSSNTCRDHLLLFSHSVLSDSSWLHGLHHARLPCASPTLRVCSNSSPLSWTCHPTISSPVDPSLPAFNLSQHQGLFQWVSSSHQVAKVLELQLQYQSFHWIFSTDFL